MAFFTPGEAAALARGTVRIATLVDLMFGGTAPNGGPVYLWNGFGTRVFAGKTYWGAGDIGQIEGLEEIRGPVSHSVTFTLSGVPDSPADLLAKTLEATDIVQGRHCIVSLQLFDGAWAAEGNPMAVYIGLMMPPRVSRIGATETSGARRTLVLPSENAFFARGRPASGRYTDREQQTRYPGDLFCSYAPQLINATINWPDYGWLLVIASSVLAMTNVLA